MTTEDFSDRFDVLLNSYSQQFLFGNGGNRGDIQLDEYEKSSLLSQAQDDIIKSYFVGDSANGGFDDTSRRQIDFSSLITVANIYPTEGSTFDSRGILYQMPTTHHEYKKVYIGGFKQKSLNDLRISVRSSYNPSKPSVPTYNYYYLTDSNGKTTSLKSLKAGEEATLEGTLIGRLTGKLRQTSEDTYVIEFLDSSKEEAEAGITLMLGPGAPSSVTDAVAVTSLNYSGYTGEEILDPLNLDIIYEDKEHIVETGTTDVLYILNEKLTDKETGKDYVIVPINYKEYDREMSKPYAQPYKKQAWRLLQNITTGFDLVSELIPTQSLANLNHTYIYKIRYVRRPTPIILVDLPNGLQIDGCTQRTECTLNPILHNDILQRAVDLAIQTRLSTSARYDALTNRNNSNNRSQS